jgi:S-adenosylmethionine-diacylgycerolhomoserine-N-methlytransferase
MSLVADLKILYHLALAPIRGRTHQERLESFYAPQAVAYDSIRKHLLHGREDLYQKLADYPANIWVEMGGGTGSTLELLGERIRGLEQVHLVDLSPSLLRVAEERIARMGWTNVTVHVEDVTTFTPPVSADVVTFSYSLTMIPDWFVALDNARRILKPGGIVAAVDYYVSRNHPAPGFVRHGRWTRTYGPTMFAKNNVAPSPDHVPYLHHYFEPVFFEERQAKIRWMPWAAVPYYLFIGRKPLG